MQVWESGTLPERRLETNLSQSLAALASEHLRREDHSVLLVSHDIAHSNAPSDLRCIPVDAAPDGRACTVVDLDTTTFGEREAMFADLRRERQEGWAVSTYATLFGDTFESVF